MSFLATLPANTIKFSYIAVGIPTYLSSSDSSSLSDRVSERLFEILDIATAIERSVKVSLDTSIMVDLSNFILMRTSETASLIERHTYMYKESREISLLLDLLKLKTMIVKDRAKLREYSKTMGLEKISLEQLDEYLSEVPTLMKTTLPNIISTLRYVKDGDMVLASDFNEILAFAKNSMKVVLALIKLIIDNNIDIPKEVMDLITEVIEVLW